MCEPLPLPLSTRLAAYAVLLVPLRSVQFSSVLADGKTSLDPLRSVQFSSVLVVIYLPSVLVVCVGVFSFLVEMADQFSSVHTKPPRITVSVTDIYHTIPPYRC